MIYSPKPENTKPLIITVLLVFFSVICFMAASVFPTIKWLLQLLFVCFATAAIQILLKYVLTNYEYKCENNSLYIYKSVGKKTLLVGALELKNSASYLMTLQEFKKSGDNYRSRSEYNYTRNYKTENTYIYVTTIGETNFTVKIEANSEFAEYINQKIDESMKGQTDDYKI